MNDLILIILTVAIGGTVIYLANVRCNEIGGTILYAGKSYICNK